MLGDRGFLSTFNQSLGTHQIREIERGAYLSSVLKTTIQVHPENTVRTRGDRIEWHGGITTPGGPKFQQLDGLLGVAAICLREFVHVAILTAWELHLEI